MDKEKKITDKLKDTIPDKPKKIPSKKFSVPVKKIISIVLKSVLIIAPISLFIGVIPYLLVSASSIAQAFVNSTNFTIEANTIDIDSVKKEPKLKMDSNGRTNVMIVGIDTRVGGYGSNLKNTDTMIVASYDHKTHRLSMVSFPRDLSVVYPNSGVVGKINATYARGEMLKRGTGLEYLKKELETISGTKIQYYGMVDLKGFERIINLLGGVEVNVERAFSGRYPNRFLRWETVSFKAGTQKMNGEKALKYARIRYAYPPIEAIDFARAERQQRVIQAVIDKAQKQENLHDTKKIYEIMQTVAGHIKISQVTPDDLVAGLTILKEKGKPEMYSLVLDPSSGAGRLIVRGSGTLYSIQPRAGIGNWGNVKTYLRDYFNEPIIVTSGKPIYVYNAGNSNFSKQYNSFKSRFYYANIKSGKTTNQTGSIVYTIGSSKYENLGKYIANYFKIPYGGIPDASLKIPRPSDTKVVVILGK